jgi:hypothetical protein
MMRTLTGFSLGTDLLKIFIIMKNPKYMNKLMEGKEF